MIGDQLHDYPHLMEALELLALDNGLVTAKDWDHATVPLHWQERFKKAEATAAELSGQPCSAFIDCDDLEQCSDQDDALEMVVNGEQTVAALLVEAAKGEALSEVLNEAFDGSLHALVYVSARSQHHAH